MADTDYRQTTSQVVIAALKEEMGHLIKNWYDSDVLIFPLSGLPAIVVTEPTTQYNAGPTGHDQIVHNMLIQIVFNKRDDIGKPPEGASVERKLELYAQGRTVDTGTYRDDTIMGVLRRNMTLGNMAINSIGDVRKGEQIRSEQQTTSEAHIEVTLTELVPVPVRE